VDVADRVLRSAVAHLLVYGKGFNGFGGEIERASSVGLSYSKWTSVLERCYSEKHTKKDRLTNSVPYRKIGSITPLLNSGLIMVRCIRAALKTRL
jgi:hypothetical protein